MFASGDNILGSGMEPCLLAYSVPVYGIIIIGPGALIMLFKQC